MKMNRTKETSVVEIRFDNEIINIENVFIGGRIAGEDGSVMGFYGGSLDVGEMGISLMCLLRGAIKAFHEECELSLEECEKLILVCLTEAFHREAQEKSKESLQKELYKVVNRFMKNQN
jgi:hypothetical protein